MAIWHQLEPAISGLTLSTLLPAVAILYVCGAASVVFYRLFLHPLSRFPGPRIAAATGWYHTYYDIWKGGKMTQNIAKLHEIYGPIVRIGPNGIHFSDPTAYSTIYSVNSKFLKDPVVYSAFSAQESSFGFVDPHAARGRRTVLNPLFSRRAAIDMQWLVVEKFEKLCQRLGEPNDSGKPINLLWAFRSTTIDIISAFCFANSLDALDVKGFNSPLLVTFNAAAGAFKITKNFPLIAAFLRNSPPWFTKLMSTEIAAIQEVVSVLGRQIDSLMANPEELKNAPHPIIYNRLLDDTIKGASAAPPTRKSLLEEAQVLLFAGSDTVGLTLTNGVFHVLDNPAVHQKLMEELTTAWPNLGTAPGYEDLEKLPYLTAVVKESLRVANGVVSQLPRITPSPGVVISGEHIPAGTVVMMSAPIVHANEEIFPDSQTFIPERWQQPNSQHLDNYLVTFSKGSRQCLGINLAYCELYVGFANIFRRCEIQPTTTKENLDWVDNFVAHYPGGGLEGFVKLRAS